MRSTIRALASTVAFLVACAGPGGVANVPHADSPSLLGARGAREHVIYDFQGGSDGASPQGTLIADASGALYGTTEYGGSGGCTVFRLMPAGSSYTETILHVFTSSTDGTGPFGGLTMDRWAIFSAPRYSAAAARSATRAKDAVSFSN
ncbi:MAG: choice-of-anchor tandem repeat GloVer-containing protein [Candidatus Cybelea sp.]